MFSAFPPCRKKGISSNSLEGSDKYIIYLENQGIDVLEADAELEGSREAIPMPGLDWNTNSMGEVPSLRQSSSGLRIAQMNGSGYRSGLAQLSASARSSVCVALDLS